MDTQIGYKNIMIKAKQESSNLINVTENYANQRIDNFLLRELKNLPKSHIYKILRSGEVRVNGKRVKASHRLCLSDVIRLPPLVRQPVTKPISLPKNFATDLLKRIIYEDDALLVLNKPAGMASHGGSGLSFGVIEAMRIIRPDVKNLELVHRLDKDTSGLILLAKKRSMLRTLHTYLREGGLTKTYVLLVKGKWPYGKKAVNVGLLKNRLPSGERVVKVSNTGKDSLTVFRPIDVFAAVSFLEAQLFTGKTHQIRVHAAHVGYPIVGDDKYGDHEFNKEMAKLGVKRLLLHAAKVQFKLPDSGQEVMFTAPLAKDMEDVLSRIT